jgi:hypothetical protein
LHVHVSWASCSWFNIFHDVVKRLNGVVGHLGIVRGKGAAGRNNRWLDWGGVVRGMDMVALG